MNHERYLQAMSAIGYPREVAESLIRLSKDSTDLALRINSFVPVGGGLYEIWLSDERDYFYRARESGSEFLGTLSDAYEYVFEQTRRWRDAQGGSQ